MIVSPELVSTAAANGEIILISKCFARKIIADHDYDLKEAEAFLNMELEVFDAADLFAWLGY